jgi:hypothetical protein
MELATMTDTSDPTGTMSQTRRLRALVIDGSLRLSGDDFDGSTIEVERGATVEVRIDDPAGYHVYGNELRPLGERAGCWDRNAERGIAHRSFGPVEAEIANVVFAVTSNEASNVATGPVIKIKPKGG